MTTAKSQPEKTITTENLILKCTEGKPIILKMKTNREYRDFLRSLRIEQEKSQAAVTIAQPFSNTDRLKEDEITLDDVINVQPISGSDKKYASYKKWGIFRKWDGHLTPPRSPRWRYSADSEYDSQYRDLESSPISMFLVDVERKDQAKYFENMVKKQPQAPWANRSFAPNNVSAMGVVVEESTEPEAFEVMETLARDNNVEVLTPQIPKMPAVNLESTKAKNKNSLLDYHSWLAFGALGLFEAKVREQLNDQVGNAGLLYFIRERFQKEMPKQWYIAIKAAHDGIKNLVQEREEEGEKDRHNEKEVLAEECEKIASRAVRAIDFTYAGGEVDKELMKQTIKGFVEFVSEPVPSIVKRANFGSPQKVMGKVLDNVALRAAKIVENTSNGIDYASAQKFVEDLFANTLAERILEESRKCLSAEKGVTEEGAKKQEKMMRRLFECLEYAPESMVESVGREVRRTAQLEGTDNLKILTSILTAAKNPCKESKKASEIFNVFATSLAEYDSTGNRLSARRHRRLASKSNRRK